MKKYPRTYHLPFSPEVHSDDKLCDINDRHEMPNGGYAKENGITLCPQHHMAAEKFHMTKGESPQNFVK